MTIDLAPCWPTIVRRAQARIEARREQGNFVSPHSGDAEKADLLGVAGEWAWSLATGQRQDESTLVDLGFDTPDGTNVKAIEHPTHRLVVTPGKLGKAKRFVLVYVDLPNRLATILGTASREQVEASPPQDLGHGPRYALWQEELTRFAPPQVDTPGPRG